MTAANPARPLGVENLEARRVMAGNVFVMHGNNTLNIFGDTNDNQIVLTEVSPGTVRVTGLYNTTINGRYGTFDFKNPSDNLNIIMGRGGDYVGIGSFTAPASRFGTVSVSTGADRDNVVVQNTVAYGRAWSSFNLGDEYENDVDYFTMDRCNFQSTAISSGGGDDWLYAEGNNVTTMVVNAGAGRDLLWLTGNGMNELYASLGEGDDQFRSWNSQPRTTRWVHGGNGNDSLLLGRETGPIAAWHFAFVGESFENRKAW
jgi:hypothetical protein